MRSVGHTTRRECHHLLVNSCNSFSYTISHVFFNIRVQNVFYVSSEKKFNCVNLELLGGLAMQNFWEASSPINPVITEFVTS